MKRKKTRLVSRHTADYILACPNRLRIRQSLEFRFCFRKEREAVECFLRSDKRTLQEL